MITKSKVKHTINLSVQDEALLQQASEIYSGGRRLNSFIKALITIGLNSCLNLSDRYGENPSINFDRLHVVAIGRNANRAEGRPAQEKTNSCTYTLSPREIALCQDSAKELVRRMDDLTPHYDTKIIPFPQSGSFMGSA